MSLSVAEQVKRDALFERIKKTALNFDSLYLGKIRTTEDGYVYSGTLRYAAASYQKVELIDDKAVVRLDLAKAAFVNDIEAKDALSNIAKGINDAKIPGCEVGTFRHDRFSHGKEYLVAKIPVTPEAAENFSNSYTKAIESVANDFIKQAKALTQTLGPNGDEVLKRILQNNLSSENLTP